jgi:hypothetical protein
MTDLLAARSQMAMSLGVHICPWLVYLLRVFERGPARS